MFQVVHDQNAGIMADIINRYPGNIETLVDMDQNSLPILACKNGDNKILKVLLEKGMNPNFQNLNGDTALHYAINGKYLKCIDLLIQFGCDEKLENHAGKTPWELWIE